MLPPVAILAGGLSTRLFPVTKTIPKALIEVAGEPFISHQLKLLKKKGARRIVLCIGNLGEMIRDYAGDGSRFGLEIVYSFDGDSLLGTGGAVKKAVPLLDKTFFVMYGDSYLDIDLSALEKELITSGKKAVMAVYKNEGKFDKSNIVFKNGKILKYDKSGDHQGMDHIDYGIAIIKKECLDSIPDGKAIDLADIYGKLVDEGQMAGYEVFKRFYEIGSFAGIEELNNLLGAK